MLEKSKKNAFLIPILVLFGINMVLAATNVTQWMAEGNFRVYSESTINDLMRKVRPDVDAALADIPADAGPGDVKQVLDRVLLSGPLVAYKLLDPQGKEVLFSVADRLFSAEIGDGIDGPDAQSAHMGVGTSLFADSGVLGQYRHVDIALPDTGPVVGSLRVFVDQSNALALFYASHQNITLMAAWFFAVALFVVIYVVWSRLKEQWMADSKLVHLAHHDGLTDLPKREVFIKDLNYALGRIEEGRDFVALMCLDMDKFKQINDTMGHATGDALLKEFSNRLNETTRKTDLLCRFGGDEFGVALIGLKSLEMIAPFANRLCEKLAEPYQIDGREFVASASIGVAIAPSDGDSAEALLKCADLALYRSKAEGGEMVCFFERSMDTALQLRMQLEHDLKTAMSGDQFELHYQPQFDLDNGLICGREALVRWNHPTKGLVQPDAFIPIAESTGLIIPLSCWILETACREAATWDPNLKLAVNLSPLQFKAGNVVDLVTQTLAVTGLPAHRLELEITETTLMTNTEQVKGQLHALKDLGVQIVMDDFGTGYSSLSYLASFPFDKIKIDRSFVSQLSQNPMVELIVDTIVGLCHNLKITITAEGIETREQEAILRSCGCDHGQGFLYGRPALLGEHQRPVEKSCVPIRPFLVPKPSNAETLVGAKLAEPATAVDGDASIQPPASPLGRLRPV